MNQVQVLPGQLECISRTFSYAGLVKAWQLVMRESGVEN